MPGGFPEGIAVDPQGHRAYVIDEFGDRLTVIDTLTSKQLGSPLAVARGAFAAAVDSAHGRVYVSGASEDTVWSLNTSALP